ncbi:MAG: hypothetical protein WAZ98_14450 [Cyclobacteriaceae bacterium]
MRIPVLILVLFGVFFASKAQNRRSNNENSLEGVPFKERIVTGGGLGLSFGSNQDFISLSPIIGYAFTKKFVAGTGLTYQYTKYKDVYPGQDVATNNFGINPFLRYTVYQGIFLQTEYEYLNYEGIILPDLNTERDSFTSFMAGGGFMQPIGDKAGFFLLAMYNFSYRDPKPGEYLPYASPWVIRAGINVGALSF